MTPWLTVVGMGDDGPGGLAPAARAVVEQARVVVGGRRHLDLLGPGERERIPWPKPFGTLDDTLERLHARGRPVCVLATGDPTCYGVGSILVERFGLEAVRIIPAPSAFSLACARLGWAAQGVQTLSLHGRPTALLHPFIQPGVRLLALSANAGTPGEVARMLCARGYGASRLTVLSHLGGEKERMHRATAESYRADNAAESYRVDGVAESVLRVTTRRSRAAWTTRRSRAARTAWRSRTARTARRSRAARTARWRT